MNPKQIERESDINIYVRSMSIELSTKCDDVSTKIDEISTKNDEVSTKSDDDVTALPIYDGSTGWFEYKTDNEWISFEMKDQSMMQSIFPDRVRTDGPNEATIRNGEKVTLCLHSMYYFYHSVIAAEKVKYRNGELLSQVPIIITGGILCGWGNEKEKVRLS